MIREIKFRGKYVGTGEWVYGGFFKATFCDGRGERVFIKENGSDRTEVDPKTVGQLAFVDVSDRTEVYEGDIVRYDHEDGIVVAEVAWEKNEDEDMWVEGFVYSFIRHEAYTDEVEEGEPIGFEVLGNIHDNPELLLQLPDDEDL